MGSAYSHKSLMNKKSRTDVRYHDNLLDDVLVILITEGNHAEAISATAKLKDKIEDKIYSSKLVNGIASYVTEKGLDCSRYDIPGLLHFVFMDLKTHQFVQSMFPRQFRAHRWRKWYARNPSVE
eukprot:gb/GECG01014392.1/.p1 GENE.gb/GECG01014392.1/~~gb/GECG01014392.1/.p1  ORF type:complete len:124 (+),score=6.76 gb/GECG01014392.1/:1-372(+)